MKGLRFQMKIKAKPISAILMLPLLLGCTAEQVSRALYEGATTQERLQSVPAQDEDPMTYDQYQIKRKEKPE